jgi:hypothetical protein
MSKLTIPRWLAVLLSPTPGCECETCFAIRHERRRITQLQVEPRKEAHERV